MAHGAEAQQCGRPLACGPGSLRSESQAIRGGGLLKVGGSASWQCPNSRAGGSESESESEQRNPRTPRAAVSACGPLAPGTAGQAHIARTIRREVTVLIRSTAPARACSGQPKQMMRSMRTGDPRAATQADPARANVRAQEKKARARAREKFRTGHDRHARCHAGASKAATARERNW